MWIRKTSAEIYKRDRLERFSPKNAFLLALIGATILTVSRWRAWGGKWNFVIPENPSLMLFSSFPFAFLFCFVVFYFLGICFGRRLWDSGSEAVICPKCHQVGRKVVGPNCACGAKSEPLKNWRWIDNESEIKGLKIK